MGLFGSRLKYVSSRVWDASADAFDFPELSDPELRVGHLDAYRRQVGVAFSGGGTRSASATVGQLRGLHELGLLSHVGYISCVSGGSWAAVPYTFLPSPWGDGDFLGRPVAPERLSPAVVSKLDHNCFAHAVAHSVLIDNFLGHALRLAGDQTYARAIGDTFLRPFAIGSLQRFFTQDQRSVEAILRRNPTTMQPTDFYVTKANRPFLIAGATLLRRDSLRQTRKYHFEMTPLYVGVHTLHRNAGSRGRHIGGGYIEPFAFDSGNPDQKPKAGVARVRLGTTRHRFTLCDVVGVSGAAPAEVLDKLHLDWLGFPEYKYWSPLEPGRSAKEYEFGDGGHLENLGVMPLLLRGVTKMVVFINTRDPLSDSRINDSLPPLFGQTPQFMLNHVFPAEDYRPLVNALRSRQEAGETVMHRMGHRVLPNDHYGIAGGQEADVLWVYNERVEAWEDRLPRETRNMIGHGSLGNFPHYKTFLHNPPAVIDLSAKQTSLLAHLSCWNVMANESAFRGLLERR